MNESEFPSPGQKSRQRWRRDRHREARAHHLAGPPFGGGHRGRHHGRKARRGDIRTAALLLLTEEARNGYPIRHEIEERSQGAWRPSPGSVYPTLQQLEDEGLVRSTENGGQHLFEATDAGRAALEERGQDVPPPWEAMAGGVGKQALEFRLLIRQVVSAAMQVTQAGSNAQIAEASKLLVDLRRSLYRILAEGDEKD
jgi:DNA-binding PadR family transcriptional regulator